MAGLGRIYTTSVKPVGDIKSTHQYDVSLRFDIAFDYGGWNSSGNASYTITCDGQKSSGNATFSVPSGGGSWVWANIGDTKTFRVTMPSSGKAKRITVSGGINTGVTPSYISASGVHDLSAVTWQWTVSYNANGGSGAPSSQTKTYGSTLKLSSTIPKRTGYTFKGWATSSSGSVAYAAGANYTSDASITLYAIWQINKYTVSYNANGGSGAPSSQTKTYGSTLKLSSTIPTRVNYNFLGWSTSSKASTAQYNAGGNYTSNASATLYAVWKLAYTSPVISNLKVDRCDSDGSLNDYGAYMKISFKWSVCTIISGITVSTVKIVWGSTTTNVSATGTSGTVNQILGGSITEDTAYNITVTVVDSENGKDDKSTILSASVFPLDLLAGGHGVSVGKPATTEGFNVGMKAAFDKTVTFNKGTGGSWLTGKTATNCSIRLSNIVESGKFYPKVYIKSVSGHVLNFGGVNDEIGFYGIKASQTENAVNFRAYWNMETGTFNITGGKLCVEGKYINPLTAYPVGAVYISYVSTSPQTLFGGTWVSITGRFPYFNAGTGTGGSNTHTLTVNQMPSHTHEVFGGWDAGSKGASWFRTDTNNPKTSWSPTGSKGGGQAHNNMPAYQTLYAWRRTQ